VLAIQDQLKKIGIEIKPNHLPAGTFFGTYAEGADMPLGKFDMALYTTGFYPDPWNDNFLCSSVPSKDSPLGTNSYHLCDPKMDDLFTQANASSDTATRKKVFDEIQKYMYDNVLIIPLYGRLNLTGYTDHLVIGPTSGIGGFHWDAYNWDLK